MAEHYYTPQPQSEHRERLIRAEACGLALEFVTDAGEVLESGYNYDEEQDEDTFSTVLQEVVAEAEAAAEAEEDE